MSLVDYLMELREELTGLQIRQGWGDGCIWKYDLICRLLRTQSSLPLFFFLCLNPRSFRSCICTDLQTFVIRIIESSSLSVIMCSVFNRDTQRALAPLGRHGNPQALFNRSLTEPSIYGERMADDWTGLCLFGFQGMAFTRCGRGWSIWPAHGKMS